MKKTFKLIKSLGLLVALVLALSFTTSASAETNPVANCKFTRASRVLYVNANNPFGMPTEFQFTVENLPENYASLYNFYWTSAKPEVATVDETGKVKAVSLGTTLINLEIKDKTTNKTLKALRGVIKVNENAKGIVIENESEISTAKFYIGDTRELKVALLNQNNQMSHDDGFVSDVIGFMSSNIDVVDVDKNGTITIMGSGKAVVTAYTVDPGNTKVHTAEKKIEINIESLALDFSMKVSACDGFVLGFSETVSANDIKAGGKLYKISSPDSSYQSQGIGSQIEIPYTVDYIDGRNVYIKTTSMLDVSTYYIFNFRNVEKNVKVDYGTPKTAKLITKETVLANKDHKLYLQLLDSAGVDVTAKYYNNIYSVLVEKRVGNSSNSEYVYEIGKDGLLVSEFVASPCTINYTISALYVGSNADTPLLETTKTIEVTGSYTPEIPATDVVMNGTYWSTAASGVGNIELSNTSATLYCDQYGFDNFTVYVRISDKNGLPYTGAEPEVICKNEASKNDTCLAPDALINYISDGLYSVRFTAMGINSIRDGRSSESWEYLVTINGVSSSVFTVNCYKDRTVPGNDLKKVDATYKFPSYDVASVDSISFSLNNCKGTFSLGESGDTLYPLPANRTDYVADDYAYFYTITKDGKDVTSKREVVVAGSTIVLPLYEEKTSLVTDCKNCSISDLILSGSYSTVASYADYSGEGYGAGEYKVSIWQVYEKSAGNVDKRLVSSKTITVTDNSSKYTLANTYAKAPVSSSMYVTDLLINKFDLRMDGKKLTANDLQIENLGLSYAVLADNKGIYIRKISLVVYDPYIQANKLVEFEVSDYIYTK